MRDRKARFVEQQEILSTVLSLLAFPKHLKGEDENEQSITRYAAVRKT